VLAAALSDLTCGSLSGFEACGNSPAFLRLATLPVAMMFRRFRPEGVVPRGEARIAVQSRGDPDHRLIE